MYEGECIYRWLAISSTSPITYEPLATEDLVPDHALRKEIQTFESDYIKNLVSAVNRINALPK